MKITKKGVHEEMASLASTLIATTGLLHLPVELMAVIVSYVTSETQDILKLSCVCKSLQNIVLNDTDGDGAIWRSLTKETFRVTDEKFQNFPKIRSHKALYSILQEFVAKEGFYVLAETLPWGVLFLWHFLNGNL